VAQRPAHAQLHEFPAQQHRLRRARLGVQAGRQLLRRVPGELQRV
jgi:alkylation response protein AidB-like acyl-CoA dehydrogenase